MKTFNHSLLFGQRSLPESEVLPGISMPIVPQPVPADDPVITGVASALMMQSNNMGFSRKTWHSHHHSGTRETLKQCVAQLIQQRRPHASPEWREKLSEVAERVEERLYFTARSYEEYKDSTTLLDRLHLLVQSLMQECTIRNDYARNYSDNVDHDDAYVQDYGGFDESYSDGSKERGSSRHGGKGDRSRAVNRAIRQVSSQGCSRVFIVKGLLFCYATCDEITNNYVVAQVLVLLVFFLLVVFSSQFFPW